MAVLFSGRGWPEMRASLPGFATTPPRAPGASKVSLIDTITVYSSRFAKGGVCLLPVIHPLIHSSIHPSIPSSALNHVIALDFYSLSLTFPTAASQITLLPPKPRPFLMAPWKALSTESFILSFQRGSVPSASFGPSYLAPPHS